MQVPTTADHLTWQPKAALAAGVQPQTIFAGMRMYLHGKPSGVEDFKKVLQHAGEGCAVLCIGRNGTCRACFWPHGRLRNARQH